MIQKEIVDTLIVSDIHLGSNASRVKDLTGFLRSNPTKRLILNGDVFDSSNYKRLRDKDWEFLSLLREMTGNGNEVVWIAGNHDMYSKNFFLLVGAKVCSEYIFSYNEGKYLVIHGHQFDRFLIKSEKVSETMRMPYRLLQRMEGEKQRVSRLVKRGYKKWLRLSKRVSRGAAAHAAGKGIGAVICGHTHHPMDTVVHGVRYMNCGSWAEAKVAYVEFAGGNVSVQVMD